MAKGAGITRSVPPHKWRHFLFTWLKKQGLVALPLLVCSKYHRLAVHNYASIEVKNLARHVGRVVRGQEHIGRRKLIRLTWPLHRHLLAKLLNLLFGHGLYNQGRPDGSRGYRVNSNAFLNKGL